MLFRRSLLGLVCALGAAHPAAALDCKPTCPRGYECKTSLAAAESAGAQEVAACAAVPCTSNADCASEMVCADAVCVMPHGLPCALDSDCGAGFVCRELCQHDDPQSTSCTKLGEFACFALTRECERDAQCWRGWSCGKNPLAAVTVNSVTQVQRCQSPLPLSMCRPPYDWLMPPWAGYWEWELLNASGQKPTVVEVPCASAAAEEKAPTAVVKPASGCSVQGGKAAGSLLTLLGFVGIGALWARRRR
ncbi:MAG: hypothetical protein QM756_25460 [Polyangiaceae bacterium]